MFPSNFVTSNLNDELESGKYELNLVHEHLNDKILVLQSTMKLNHVFKVTKDSRNRIWIL